MAFPFPVRRPSWLRLGALALLAAGLLVGRLEALTLVELLNEPGLTPERFAAHFKRFTYEFHAEVQPPEVFLRTGRGDCDDYAILADFVLRQKNFTTRLMRVSFVGGEAHDVCYVSASKEYLDYNNRKYLRTMEGSGRRLREIANEVAESFEGEWIAVSEYTYDYATAQKRIVQTVVKSDPPSRDPDA